MKMMKIAMIILTTTMTNGEGDNIISGLFWWSFGLIVQIHVQPSRIWALPRQSYDRVVCVLVWGESDSNWIPTALKHRIYIELEDVGDNLIGVGRAIFKVVIFFWFCLNTVLPVMCSLYVMLLHNRCDSKQEIKPGNWCFL